MRVRQDHVRYHYSSKQRQITSPWHFSATMQKIQVVKVKVAQMVLGEFIIHPERWLFGVGFVIFFVLFYCFVCFFLFPVQLTLSDLAAEAKVTTTALYAMNFLLRSSSSTPQKMRHRWKHFCRKFLSNVWRRQLNREPDEEAMAINRHEVQDSMV